MKLSRICAIALAAGFFAGSAQASSKKEPVTIGVSQLEQFDTVIGANARPLQPVNERLVLALASGE